jgi:predicted ABC-type transport system involved in lysophospholipase L1 biosynthesis ATPase subunit
VLVTHDPVIAARCSRTLTIAAGRVVADTLYTLQAGSN